MLHALLLGAVLSVGQNGTPYQNPTATVLPALTVRAAEDGPTELPPLTVQPRPADAAGPQGADVPKDNKTGDLPMNVGEQPKKNGDEPKKNGDEPKKNGEEKKEEEEAPKVAEEAEAAKVAPAAAPDRWGLMKTFQGSWIGSMLDDNRMSLSGWFDMSYTASSAHVSNMPVVWNDRANNFLFQQGWFRWERSVVTSGTTQPTFGGRIDILTGSDYRFSLMRSLLNSQLQNSTGAQNLYGVDPIQFYANMYVPTLFQGTEFRVGRLYTPWGAESLEGPTSPLMSKSYAFNWSPPFTHMGIAGYTTFNKQWQAVYMLANGNDVWLDSQAQEARFVGNFTYKTLDNRDSITLATSLGRGKFNAGNPFAASTVSLAVEPAGRNNFNAFDLYWIHTFNPVLAYQLEAIYAYQMSVPASASNNLGGALNAGDVIRNNGATSGTAHWASAANYLFMTFTPRLTGIIRGEVFDDIDGQRTGFMGVYEALTAGIQFRPRKSIIIRPEIRYDYNNTSRPFEGAHGLTTGGADLILRW